MIVQNIIQTAGFRPELALGNVGLGTGLSASSITTGALASFRDLTASEPMLGAARWFQEGATAAQRFAGQISGWEIYASLDAGTLAGGALLIGAGVIGGVVLLRSAATAVADWLEKSGEGADANSVWQAPLHATGAVASRSAPLLAGASLYDARLQALIDPENIYPYPGHEGEARLSLRERARLDAKAMSENIDGERSLLIRMRYEATRDCAVRDAKIIAEAAESPLQDDQLNALQRMKTQGELVQKLAYSATVFAEYARLQPRVAPVYRSVIAKIAEIEREYSRLLEVLGWDEAAESWMEMFLLHSRIALTRSSQEIALVLDTDQAGDIVTRPE